MPSLCPFWSTTMHLTLELVQQMTLRHLPNHHLSSVSSSCKLSSQ